MIRRHLTYANVTATVALVLAIGTGTVYAVGEIGSGAITNNSVKSIDLKDGRAVAGEDVRRNTLGKREVDEASLVGARIVALAGDEGADCDPMDSIWTDCVAQPFNLESPSRVLITVTGGFYSEADGAEVECEVRIDGQDTGPSGSPGEVLDNTSGLATDGFARTLVSGLIPAGEHSAALACQQIGAEDARIDSPTIALVVVTAG